MKDSGAFEIFKPFAWLATIAFLVGFVSYLALGQTPRAEAREGVSLPTVSDTASWPASDEWNVAKHI